MENIWNIYWKIWKTPMFSLEQKTYIKHIKNSLDFWRFKPQSAVYNSYWPTTHGKKWGQSIFFGHNVYFGTYVWLVQCLEHLLLVVWYHVSIIFGSLPIGTTHQNQDYPAMASAIGDDDQRVDEMGQLFFRQTHNPTLERSRPCYPYLWVSIVMGVPQNGWVLK